MKKEDLFMSYKDENWIPAFSVSATIIIVANIWCIISFLFKLNLFILTFLLLFKVVSLIIMSIFIHKFIKTIDKEELEKSTKNILNNLLFSSTFLMSIILRVLFSKIFNVVKYFYDSIKLNFSEFLTNKFFPEPKDKETYRD